MSSEDTGWSTTTLGECAKWYSGGTPDTTVADYWNGSIPWITASSLHDFYLFDSERKVTQLGLENGTRLMPENTVIFVVRGMSLKSEFRVGIARRPMAFGQDCKAIIAKEGVDPLFLANAIRAKAPEILELVDEASHGTGRLQTEAIQSVEIPLPPLPEQRAIAAILGSLDDKIELNRQMNRTLEAMAQALFKSWFVDFDPVRAKAAGRETGLPDDVAALFPERLVESEMGEIPEGWKIGTLADFAELNVENWSKSTAPEQIEYVDLSNTKWGKIESTTNYVWNEAPSRAQRVLRYGDTIVGTVRPGNGSYALIAETGLTGSTGFAVLRPHRSEFQEFVYLAATDQKNIDRLAHLADGGAYPAVRPEVVVATEAVQSNDLIAQNFSKITKPIMSKIAANEKESRTLAALRDTLLPKLISGEVRVKDAEKLLGLYRKCE